jgi:cytochrome c oxidase cbb3-type subunit 1
MDTVTILLSAFILSITGLFVFIWSLRKRMFDNDAAAAHVIFSTGEEGHGEEPAASPSQRASLAQPVSGETKPILSAAQEAARQSELAERIEADRSTAFVSFVFLSCAIVWLIVASLAGLTSSIKLHEPDWLVQQAWLTFGRIRTIHLNAVAYGWAPMAAFGVAIWMLPRLLRTPLIGGRFAILGCMLWNAGLIAGLGCIAVGLNDGMEWLEIPCWWWAARWWASPWCTRCRTARSTICTCRSGTWARRCSGSPSCS